MIQWWKKFRSQQQEIDRALRAAPPPLPRPDAALRNSILLAVRASRAAAQPESRFFSKNVWWLGGAIGAAASVALALWLVPRPVSPPPRQLAVTTEMAAAPAAALDIGAQMPAILVAPLTNEMAHVDEDLQHTGQFLFGAFP